MRIGTLAAQAGVSVRALRYYEEQGLLVSTRSPTGQRHYPDSAVGRVQLLQQLYAAGLSSRTIVGLLPCVDTPGEASTLESLRLMQEQRGRIEAQIAELMRTRDTLDAVIEAAAGSLPGAAADLVACAI